MGRWTLQKPRFDYGYEGHIPADAHDRVPIRAFVDRVDGAIAFRQMELSMELYSNSAAMMLWVSSEEQSPQPTMITRSTGSLEGRHVLQLLYIPKEQQIQMHVDLTMILASLLIGISYLNLLRKMPYSYITVLDIFTNMTVI